MNTIQKASETYFAVLYIQDQWRVTHERYIARAKRMVGHTLFNQDGIGEGKSCQWHWESSETSRESNLILSVTEGKELEARDTYPRRNCLIEIAGYIKGRPFIQDLLDYFSQISVIATANGSWKSYFIENREPHLSV